MFSSSVGAALEPLGELVPVDLADVDQAFLVGSGRDEVALSGDGTVEERVHVRHDAVDVGRWRFDGDPVGYVSERGHGLVVPVRPRVG